MLDFTNIFNQSNYINIFYNNGIGGTGGGQPSSGSWQTWIKPRNNCNFIWMMCVGGGAGGGGGKTNVAGLGGASAAITIALYPANLLPDILYVWVGAGGEGGLGETDTRTSTTGTTGGKSLIAVRPVPSSIYLFPGVSELVCSSGGKSWSGTSAYTQGEEANTSTEYLPKLLTLGIWNSFAGRSRPGDVDITPLIGGTITCPGADGGVANGTKSGKSILSVNLGSDIITPRINGGKSEGAKGEDGIWNWNPMYGTGGAGGGSFFNFGGNGGNGAYGCGGGGGGGRSGTAGTGAGSGGKGGDGLVIIATF